MVLLDLLGLVLFIGLIVAIPAAIEKWQSHTPRSVTKASQQELKNITMRYNVALKGLRAVANGAGNPALEAQSTLDDIESLHIKELS